MELILKIIDLGWAICFAGIQIIDYKKIISLSSVRCNITVLIDFDVIDERTFSVLFFALIFRLSVWDIL